jgi:hypothetical protein
LHDGARLTAVHLGIGRRLLDGFAVASDPHDRKAPGRFGWALTVG